MSTVTVSSSSGLMQALSSAQAGDTILLAAGFYSGLVIQNFNQGGMVTISSADTSHPAQITDMQINSSSGLSFDHIVLDSDPAVPGVTATALSDPYPIRVQSSANIHFSNMSVHGSLDNDDSNDRAGLLISASTNVSFSNSEFQQLSFGVVHSDSSNLTFTGNDFHDIRFAGIHGSSSYVSISGNYFHDFHPVAGDHPDAIHFFNETTTDAPHNISVFNNVIMTGDGSPTQGIYFELPTASSVPLNDITISNNLLVGTMYNGIAIEDNNALPNTNIQVTGNTVASIGSMTARIWLGDTLNAVETNNNAGAFIFGYGANVTFDPTNTNAGLTYANDSVIAPVTDGGQALLQQYLAANPAFIMPGPSSLGSSVLSPSSAPAASSATPPPAPTGLTLDSSTNSGPAGADITNIAQVRIDGLAQPGATVTLYDGSTVIGAGTANMTTGVFTILSTSALGNGVHSLTATAANGGGTSAASAALSLMVDTTPASAAATHGALHQTSAGVSATLNGISSDGLTLPYSVTVLQDGVQVGSATPTNGAWTYTQSNVSSSVHSYTFRTTDEAGNVGLGSNVLTLGTTGQDHIVGGAANDIIVGGGGRDTLTGGSLDNTFVYNSVGDAPYPTKQFKASETITNWTSGSDHIDLTGLGHLSFNGVTTTTNPYSVEWYESGGNTYVIGDAAGHARPDFMIELLGAHTLSSSDFLLA